MSSWGQGHLSQGLKQSLLKANSHPISTMLYFLANGPSKHCMFVLQITGSRSNGLSVQWDIWDQTAGYLTDLAHLVFRKQK